MGYAALVALAVTFYRIGEHEYRTGWPLACASLFMSLGGSYVFGIFGMIGSQISQAL
jgi:hypothetical protein